MSVFKSSQQTRAIYYLAWGVVAFFYFYQYILRISPGIMVVELRQTFKLTAQEFSSLGSIYLFAYSLLQIPLGFILDWIGAKKLIACSVLICIAGTLIFAYASDVWMLQVGRFLIGLGSAPAFIGALKIVTDHLPAKYCGLLMGTTLAIGTFGALLSGKCLVSLLDTTGWQNSLVLCAALGALILLLVLLIIPRQQRSLQAHLSVKGHFTQGLGEILKIRSILIYAAIAIAVYTPLCVLADLWGTAFLMEKFGLARDNAAQLSLYLYGGLTLGSLILPWLSFKTDKLKEIIQLCIVGLALSMFTLLYANDLSLWQITLLLTIIGVFCGAEMICFAASAEQSPPSYSGLTLGVVNTLNMLGGALAQQLIGWYLDLKWKGQYSIDGSRYYSASELTTAFTLLIALILIGGLLSLQLSRRKSLISDEIYQVNS